MSILLVLVTFLLFITISFLRGTRAEPGPVRKGGAVRPLVPQLVRDARLALPQGYSFHPGHTWVLPEARQLARIGLDNFGANLIGKMDRIELAGLNRWVRQGQKVARAIAGDFSVDVVAPVEGIVTATNMKLREDPGAVMNDPYGEGWLLELQSPDLAINLKNLLQGNLVRAWMRSALERVSTLAAGTEPALAQDGGTPIPGLLSRVEPQVRRQMISEFFLT